MASNIRVGEAIRIKVRFMDYDPIAGTDEVVTVSTVTAAIYKYIDGVFVFQNEIGPIVNESTGVYYYDWLTIEDGRFRIRFTGIVENATPGVINHDRDFYIGTSEPAYTLGADEEYVFLPELDPLYIDPERIEEYYEEVDYVEATEIIYRYSKEIQSWFGENVTITKAIEDYLIAVTLCELSKIHVFNGGLAGFTGGNTFTLGDLSVTKQGGGSTNASQLYRGNAATWCELASLLREELMYSRTGMENVMRGENWPNPIPSRSLKRFD